MAVFLQTGVTDTLITTLTPSTKQLPGRNFTTHIKDQLSLISDTISSLQTNCSLL